MNLMVSLVVLLRRRARSMSKPKKKVWKYQSKADAVKKAKTKAAKKSAKDMSRTETKLTRKKSIKRMHKPKMDYYSEGAADQRAEEAGFLAKDELGYNPKSAAERKLIDMQAPGFGDIPYTSPYPSGDVFKKQIKSGKMTPSTKPTLGEPLSKHENKKRYEQITGKKAKRGGGMIGKNKVIQGYKKGGQV